MSKLRTAVFVAVACSACGSGLDSYVFEGSPTTQYSFTEAPPEPFSVPEIPTALRDERFVTLTDGTRVAVVTAWQPPSVRTDAPTIHYSHANGADIDYYWWRVRELWSLGANVVIYDYPGFGRSTGLPTDASVTASAHATLAYVHSLPVRQDRIYIYGYSLGVAVATELAATDSEPLQGLALESGILNVDTVVAEASGLVPAGFVTNSKLDTLAHVRQAAHHSERGVRFFHGTMDTKMAPSFSETLDAEVRRAPAAGQSSLVMVPGATHFNLPIVLERENAAYSKDISSWLTP